MHVPGHLVHNLPDEELRRLWSRTQWILKSNYLPGVKWEGVVKQPLNDQQDEQIIDQDS
jgi:hypothetical protein